MYHRTSQNRLRFHYDATLQKPPPWGDLSWIALQSTAGPAGRGLAFLQNAEGTLFRGFIKHFGIKPVSQFPLRTHYPRSSHAIVRGISSQNPPDDPIFKAVETKRRMRLNPWCAPLIRSKIMFKRLISTALIFGAAALAPPASAQSMQCLPRAALIERLTVDFNEEITGGGLQNPQQLLEVWSSASTGSFTVFITRPSGIACIVATGLHWNSAYAVKDDGITG
jgi:hypothetical protein